MKEEKYSNAKIRYKTMIERSYKSMMKLFLFEFALKDPKKGIDIKEIKTDFSNFLLRMDESKEY